MNQINATSDQMCFELPIFQANLGNSVLDASGFPVDFYFQDIGLKHTSFCQSAICYIDGSKGLLLYRGYPIEELCKHFQFESIMYLLLFGELPTSRTLKSFTKKLIKYRHIPDYCYSLLEHLPESSHPMGILLTLVSALAADSSQSLDDPDEMAIRIVAQMPILVALSQRHARTLKPVHQDSNDDSLGYVPDFLFRLFGQIPTEHTVTAFDQILTLHAEHEQNASTCTLRVSGSTGTNAYAALAAAITALWGPAHGGANEACMQMLEAIKTCDRIPEYIEKAKSKEDPFRLMGFGHRVYRSRDPRADVMKSLAKEVLDSKQDKPLFRLARSLEKRALEDPYFISHQLYPNVDYYSGIVQRALGIENNAFTTIFALARTTGWMSHWLEMMRDKTPIIRPRQHYIGPRKRSL
ncbi:MAG: citrate (Si)-synthase [Legionellales bacterium]|nr:citrate (Si)-synthase [Legionellales bacterium]|tara:strand:- start:66 stop:1295 length:1230 start_codon:yes stop_codon:yes gene_type:complete